MTKKSCSCILNSMTICIILTIESVGFWG